MHDIDGPHLLLAVKLVGLDLVEALYFVPVRLLFNNVDPVFSLDLVGILRGLSYLSH